MYTQILIIAWHEEVTTIAPMAILPLNSSAQDEGTYIKQSDIIIIRSTQRLATHVGFVRAAGPLPVGQATTCLC